ncbi:DUF4147 domain-containing protein [Candidatus Uhrbacteria bacterium]|nr:DUF4147 domain-containing protein [Candidatus Uhrbacteria bacterium]
MIKNTRTLATTKLRRDALRVLDAGLRAIDTRSVVAANVKRVGNRFTISGKTFDLRAFDHIYVIGIGKAAADAGQELERILGDRITTGVILDVKTVRLKRLKSLAGTHPFPSLENMRATGEIIGILKHVEEHDLVIAVISGGGSALLCWPYELKCNQLVLLTKMLMRNGATIQEINTVRKHLSEIQGGQFAKMVYPATVVGLLFSDVPGDDPGMIASGPTVMDLTTKKDAARIMAKYDLARACRLPNCELLETPKDPKYFQRVTNHIIVSNVQALDAMSREAKRLGYSVRKYSQSLSGEAREVGRLLAGIPQPGEMVIAGGETTVTVKGKGKGGRNQEVALSALASISDDGLVASLASDGVDNSPAAGAFVDARIRERAKRLRLNPAAFLNRNDSYAFFKRAGGHILTGVTGANVSDLFLAARSRR